MERTVKIIEIARWLSLVMGGVMFVSTRDSFGNPLSAALAVSAALIFWTMMQRERSRLIGQTIASEIKKVITEISNVDSLIEIKRLKSGIIARVYLINGKDKVALIHRAVARTMEQSSFRKYLWIMQMTDMPARSALPERQRMLNEQLLEELLNRRRGDRE